MAQSSPSRDQITKSTSTKLSAAAANLASITATIGLDGFVDEIIAVVDKRHGTGKFDAIPTIDALGKRILAAAGQSGNFELVVKHAKLGGNGPIMANAMASVGISVNYIGAVGFPTIHPVFEEMAHRAKVISITEPGHTDALEFTDGKLMLGKYSHLTEVNWANIMLRVGREQLQKMVAESKVFGFVNWTMLPYLSDIWRELLATGFLKQAASGGSSWSTCATRKNARPRTSPMRCRSSALPRNRPTWCSGSTSRNRRPSPR